MQKPVDPIHWEVKIVRDFDIREASFKALTQFYMKSEEKLKEEENKTGHRVRKEGSSYKSENTHAIEF